MIHSSVSTAHLSTPTIGAKSKKNTQEASSTLPISSPASSLSSVEVVNDVNTTMTYYENGQFRTGLSWLQSTIGNASLNGQGDVLNKLMNDGALLANLKNNKTNISTQGAVNIMNNLEYPKDVILGFLLLPESIRSQVIVNNQSLSPFLYGKIQFLSTTTKNQTLLQQVQQQLPNVKAVIDETFDWQGTLFNGYVIKNSNGSLQPFMITAGSKSSLDIFTIAQWNQISQNISNGKSPMDGISKNTTQS